MKNNITFVREVIESTTTYTEFKDKHGNEFIYEDGELKDVIIGMKRIHVYSDNELEINNVN
tara:strand:- start:1824 stop:2006 length:183 start_codon:yes stop_codon:yes gene_type:complete